MVPNEPLMFAGETTNRTEDAIIAYSWDKYLRTGDARWPAQLPMTKAAVRAMDTVTAFCGSAQGGGVNVAVFRGRGRLEAGLDDLDDGGGGPAGDSDHADGD